MVIYVDPSGNDANDGSIDSPIRQLGPAIAKAKQGDSIQINPGDYSYAHAKDIAFSADEPLVIEAPAGGAIFRGDPESHGAAAIRIEGASGVRLSNLRIEAPRTQIGILLIKCSTMYVANCSVTGVGVIGIASRRSTAVDIKNCSVGGAACGIQLISNTNSNVTGCTVSRATRHGICLENAANTAITGNNVQCGSQGIICSNVLGSPFGGDQCVNVLVDNNVISAPANRGINGDAHLAMAMGRKDLGIEIGPGNKITGELMMLPNSPRNTSARKSIVLLSFPRSGSSWSRYALEHATLRQTMDTTSSYVPGLAFEGAPFIYRSHRPRGVHMHDSMLFVIRNYKEAVISHMERYELDDGIPFDGLLAHTDGETHKWRGLSIPNYLELLEHFDSYGKPKLIVYYEDLMDSPNSEIPRMADFVVPNDAAVKQRANDFLANLSRHIEKSRGLYGSGCKSSDTEFHKFKISREQRIEWDNFIRSKNPTLYDKYLARYAEPTA